MTKRAAFFVACLTLLAASAYALAQTADNGANGLGANGLDASGSAPVASTPDAAPSTADAKPVDANPADAKSVDAKPVDATPAEIAPAVAAPADTSAPPVKPADTAPPAATVATPTPIPPEKPAIADKSNTKDEPVPAKKLFAAEKLPSLGKAMAIGYYPRGCLQGGVPLPVTGPTWQVMRISRNRMWGHPSLVRFLEKFAPAAAKATGWKGVLIGDMAQPRGGPLPFGHMSHQIGLDVDIWFMPMPNHTLSSDEREKISAINLVANDWKHINPKAWTPQHYNFIRTAAEQPGVERVLVNAAIKKEMCQMQGDKHPSWMDKVRPWYGHHDHIHVRLECPADSPNCRKQPPVPESDGCGKALDYWFSDRVLHPKPRPPNAKPPRAITLADLPPACKTVLAAPDKPTAMSNNPSP
ncbi:MAG: penicillin-insensitive murein endopeptidase [Pseudolabrys sp.]|jgi:penicillin-insensitive murein endopeptidase